MAPPATPCSLASACGRQYRRATEVCSSLSIVLTLALVPARPLHSASPTTHHRGPQSQPRAHSLTYSYQPASSFSGNRSPTIRAHAVPTARNPLATLHCPPCHRPGASGRNEEGAVRALSFDGGGLLATADGGCVRLWSMEGRRRICSLKTRSGRSEIHPGVASPACLSDPLFLITSRSDLPTRDTVPYIQRPHPPPRPRSTDRSPQPPDDLSHCLLVPSPSVHLSLAAPPPRRRVLPQHVVRSAGLGRLGRTPLLLRPGGAHKIRHPARPWRANLGLRNPHGCALHSGVHFDRWRRQAVGCQWRTSARRSALLCARQGASITIPPHHFHPDPTLWVQPSPFASHHRPALRPLQPPGPVPMSARGGNLNLARGYELLRFDLQVRTSRVRYCDGSIYSCPFSLFLRCCHEFELSHF